MQMTRFTDYALRVLMFLAHAPDRRTTIEEVSRVHGISRQHLMKVVQRLSKLGYLKASRGRGGGIEAARPPEQISIGQVVRDLEPVAAVECLAGDYDGGCILFPGCGLRGVLQSAQQRFLEALDGHTLATVTPKGPPRASPRRARGGSTRLPAGLRRGPGG